MQNILLVIMFILLISSNTFWIVKTKNINHKLYLMQNKIEISYEMINKKVDELHTLALSQK